MFVPAATVRRGGLIESWHFAAAAVATPEGRSVFRLGGDDTRTFFRSCAKPFQAVPLVRAWLAALAGGDRDSFDALDDLELSREDLALICASHGGGPQHVDRARSLLARGRLTVEHLLCGAHEPLDDGYARELRAAGEEPTPLHNNCSGKHAGMLLACRLLSLPLEGYIDPEHPLQREIFTEMERFTGIPVAELRLGVDGCSVPTFHLPLRAAAKAWAALAAPRLAGLPDEVAAAAEHLLEGMAQAPEMVAGPGRFTTRLPQVTGGRVVGKEGAEGLYCIAVRGPVALGVALKIADGSERARDGVSMELLRQIGSLSAGEFDELAQEGFYRPVLRNHRRIEVGEIVPEMELEEL